MSYRIVNNFERGLTTTVNDIEHIESQTLRGHRRRQGVLPAGRARSRRRSRRSPRSRSRACVRCRRARTRRSSSRTTRRACRSCSSACRERDCPSSSCSTSASISSARSSRPCRARRSRCPYGGKQPQIQVDLDPAALQAKGLSPTDVVNAISAQNLILPGGHVEDRRHRVRRRHERQPRQRRRAERPSDQDGRHHADLHPRRRARAQRLPAADEHRSRRRPARRAC